MAYTPPANYPYVQKYRIDKMSTERERHSIHINGIAAALTADALLRTVLSNIYGWRLELQNVVVFSKLASAVSPTFSLVSYNNPGTQTYSRVDIPLTDLLVQSGPPEFNVPILYGDAMDIIFNDQGAVGVADSYLIQFEIARYSDI